MLMMDHRRVSTASDLARVWVHETRRVFADRLISYDDKGWFEDLAKQQGQEHLGLDWDETVGVPGTPRAFLMYADFLIPGAEPKVGFEREKLGRAGVGRTDVLVWCGTFL